MSGAGPLRQVLAEITAARGNVDLAAIARRVGVSRDEVDSMVAYWVRKGRLAVEEIGSGCPSGGCGGCSATACGGARGPVLLAITTRTGR